MRSILTVPRLLIWPLALVGALGGAPTTAADQDGGQLFSARCAKCHGAGGQGTQEHPQPLAGDKSIAQLAELIGKTMPEDDPGSLSARQAEAVAAYVHDAFYSAVARERNRPARVELSRLTVRQYRNAVADLVGSFRATEPWGDERGLRGRVLRRPPLRAAAAGRSSAIDPEVRFDFGTGTPGAGEDRAARVLDPLGGLACSRRRRASTSSSSAPSTPPGCGSTT